MSDKVIIKVDKVSKTFRLPHEKNNSIKSAILNFYRHSRTFEKQQVLDNVSFDIKEGEFFGIVGRNGSGKSTLLKMLAGIYASSKGSIHVNGKLTPFIELGVGFNPELTGRENVYLNGALLGFNRKEMTAMYPDIVAFAELEKFMDQKLKNYSSGMQVRLAFSIAIRAESDILLLDEVLAVGDTTFQQKCFDYFKELKKQNKTVVLVSHDAGTLRQYCTKGVFIEAGKIIYEGPIDHVVNQYQDSLIDAEKTEVLRDSKAGENRWGNQKVVVQKGLIKGAKGKEQAIFTDDDDLVNVTVRYKANAKVEQPIFGITVTDATGLQIFASNTKWAEVEIANMVSGDIQEVSWAIPNLFNSGTYTVDPAVSDTMGITIHDWREGFMSFKVRKKINSSALTNLPHTITVHNSKAG
jgi:ABC-2 type transport system ATP-binding protein